MFPGRRSQKNDWPSFVTVVGMGCQVCGWGARALATASRAQCSGSRQPSGRHCSQRPEARLSVAGSVGIRTTCSAAQRMVPGLTPDVVLDAAADDLVYECEA
jgi:hypothetical protein